MHISKIFPALILGFLGLSDAHAADGFYIGASAGAYLREDSTFTVHAVGNPSITGLGSESYDPGAIVKWPGTQQGRSCAYCQSGAAIPLRSAAGGKGSPSNCPRRVGGLSPTFP